MFLCSTRGHIVPHKHPHCASIVAEVVKDTLIPPLMLSPLAFWPHLPLKWQKMVLPAEWCSPSPVHFADIVRKAGISSMGVVTLVILVGSATWPRAQYKWMDRAVQSHTEYATFQLMFCFIYEAILLCPWLLYADTNCCLGSVCLLGQSAVCL